MHWQRRTWFVLFTVLVLAIVMPGASALADSRWHVDDNAAAGGDGLSWGAAFNDLQAALAAAGPGDQIWVAAGTYHPGTSRSDTFRLLSGVAIYGGFAGTETVLGERDWEANVTTLSGDIGSPNDNHDNSYHVVTGSETESSAVLDGFTVEAGNADGPYPVSVCFSEETGNICGGGMHIYYGSPTLTNLRFVDNRAHHGGGMHIYYGSPKLTNVEFLENKAICIYNRAQYYSGGGMANSLGSPTLINVTFANNTANTTVPGRSCGGGWGGGMRNNGENSPQLVNVVFYGNQASQYGGGIRNHVGSIPILTNVTMYGNHAPWGGGISSYSYQQAGVDVRNSILWGNTPDQLHYQGSSGYTTVSYSDIQGGWAGMGNLNADPLFVDAANADLRLTPTSPVLDMGNNAHVPGDVTTDLDGNQRIADSSPPFDGPIVDMGAYEQVTCRRSPVIHVDDNPPIPGDGSDWEHACTDLRAALAVADSGDQIWVAAGTYKPTEGTNRSISFTLKDGVELYGGFAGIETTPEQRDWEANATILSGDIGAIAASNDNSYQVVKGIDQVGLPLRFVLDGFTIAGGNSTGYGGGMDSRQDDSNSSATLRNVNFSDNSAAYGGGMSHRGNVYPPYAKGGLELTNIAFSENSANYGGGMYRFDVNATLTNIIFSDNQASQGGGIYNQGARPTLTNIIFSGNSASTGGGMYSRDSIPTLTNVTFNGNQAGNGGAIYIVNNESPIQNSIVWGNSSPQIGWRDHTPRISYSDIEGGWAGPGSNNISADPQFEDAANGDLHLTACSPAIDVGNNAHVPGDVTTDLDGNPRIVNGEVDMGAYEHGVADATPPQITPTVDGTPGANGWYVSDVIVSWTVTDPESTVCSTNGCDTIHVTADTAATILTCEATSIGGAIAESVTIKRDATAPTASASLSPAEPNENGWYNSDVTVSFSASDSLSGLAFCDPDVILADEGAGQSASGACTDMAGNVSAPADSGAINIDKTAPTTSASASPPANANGWNNADVTVSFGASDDLSGVAFCDADVILSDEGAELYASGACTDMADNVSAQVTSGVINIDKTAPEIVPPDDLEVMSTVSINVDYPDITVTDNLDPNPAVSFTPPTGSVFPVGDSTVTCAAEDVADNITQASFVVSVLTTGDVVDSVRVGIDTLLADPNVPDGAKEALGKAGEKLDKALEELAEGDVKNGLGEIGKAVKELLDAADEGAEVADLINRLVQTAQTEAQDAIDAALAVDFDPKEMAKAEAEMVKAQAELEASKPDKAISHYKKAWEYAQKAMPEPVEGARTRPDALDQSVYLPIISVP